jgi:hypothetical protein
VITRAGFCKHEFSITISTAKNVAHALSQVSQFGWLCQPK